MVDHRVDIEDMDGVNADKLFEVMEIKFGNIMDEKSRISKTLRTWM